MRRAAALLAAGAASVERAAGAVGYDNPFAFSSAFKRVIGKPPSAFKSD
jgi:AraC-like DNA-binding protein